MRGQKVEGILEKKGKRHPVLDKLGYNMDKKMNVELGL